MGWMENCWSVYIDARQTTSKKKQFEVISKDSGAIYEIYSKSAWKF